MISKRTIRNLLNKSLKNYSLHRIAQAFFTEYQVGFIDCLVAMNKPLLAKRYFIITLIDEFYLDDPEDCSYHEKGVREEFDNLIKDKVSKVYED